MRFFIVSFALLSAISLNGADSKVLDIQHQMEEKNQARWANVEGYVVAKKALSKPIVTLHLPLKEDGKMVGFYQVSPHEIQKMMDEDAGITPEARRQMAAGYQWGLAELLEGAASNIEIPSAAAGELMYGAGTFLFGASEFLNAGAPSDQEIKKRDAMDKQDQDHQIKDMAKFFETAKLVGTEKMDGRTAYHLLSKDKGRKTQTKDGIEFQPDETHVWICKKDLVILKFSVRGDLTSKGQKRRFAVEQTSSNFKKVGSLYEPFTQVMSLGGVLTPKEQAQMEESKKQLAEMEVQLKKLPPSQQAMMQSMFGQQMDTLKNLVNNGNMQVATETLEIKIGGFKEYMAMQLKYAKGLADPALIPQ